MKGLLAKKLMMSQSIAADGKVQPITILEVVPNVIRQIKTTETDGYFALQLAFPKINAKKGFTKIAEFNYPEGEYKIGDSIAVDIFTVGDKVQATGVTKGKGFAGTIKRHNFSSGPSGHGHDHHRAPGSLGPMGIARVIKGRRMGGHMGATQITVKNLSVVAIDPSHNLIAISGAIPGANKQMVMITQNGGQE
ncbi:MAG: 50S ribosomal protein L3 [Patescibacteria group bacterium]|jgi:large subunit ribosomal protein L3